MTGRPDITWLSDDRLMWLALDARTLAGVPAPTVLLPAVSKAATTMRVSPSTSDYGTWADEDDQRGFILCVAPHRLWWRIGGALYQTGTRAGPARRVPNGTEIEQGARCTDHRLIGVSAHAQPRLLLCNVHACTNAIDLSPMQSGSLPQERSRQSGWPKSGLPQSGSPLAIGPRIGPVLGVQTNRILVVYSGDPAKAQRFVPHPLFLLPARWHVEDFVVWSGRLFAVVVDGQSRVHILPVPLT